MLVITPIILKLYNNCYPIENFHQGYIEKNDVTNAGIGQSSTTPVVENNFDWFVNLVLFVFKVKF